MTGVTLVCLCCDGRGFLPVGRTCAKDGCHNVFGQRMNRDGTFPKKMRSDSIYCSVRCASAQSMRFSRARKANR